MDGESAFLPADRQPCGILLAWNWKDAALFHRRDYRGDVRPAFSTRRSRIRIESRLGSGLWHLLVVSWAADPQATFTWACAGLVTLARARAVRLAHGSYRLRPDCRRDLCRFGQTLGRLFHRQRSDKPPARRPRFAYAALVRPGRDCWLDRGAGILAANRSGGGVA